MALMGCCIHVGFDNMLLCIFKHKRHFHGRRMYTCALFKIVVFLNSYGLCYF